MSACTIPLAYLSKMMTIHTRKCKSCANSASGAMDMSGSALSNTEILYVPLRRLCIPPIWLTSQKTAVFKNQIDWIPLSTGSVRPTQGRTLAIAQVNGGSQSFNTVNSLRILGRWMRMFAIPNQSSIPMAYKQFTDEDAGSRLMPSGNRDRLVDCMEEFVKYTIVMRPHFDLFGDRYSEREEKRVKQEKELAKLPVDM